MDNLLDMFVIGFIVGLIMITVPFVVYTMRVKELLKKIDEFHNDFGPRNENKKPLDHDD